MDGDPAHIDKTRLDSLLPEIYGELRRLAGRAMREQRPDHTLQPTALVNEVYLKLAAAHHLVTSDRAHFMAVAATAMRQVLVDHARARRSAKRGGDQLRVTLHEGFAEPAAAFDLVSLDEALTRLAAIDGEQVRIVELRYMAGLTVEEAAEVLGVSPATIKRETATAKAWLYHQIGAGGRGAASRGLASRP